MNVSFYLARRSQDLEQTRGILSSTPSQKLGSSRLDENTFHLVQEFYGGDKNSRPCPWKKDYVRILEDGEKFEKSRSLLMCNLDEDFSIFKDTCELNQCEECTGPGTMFNQWKFKQWITTGSSGCSLETIMEHLPNFIKFFSEKLVLLHNFIAKKQAAFIKTTKDNLQLFEFVVISNFAENYSFVIQDEIQMNHWNNKQCTMHSLSIYYKTGEELEIVSHCGRELEHNIVFISHCYRNSFSWVLNSWKQLEVFIWYLLPYLVWWILWLFSIGGLLYTEIILDKSPVWFKLFDQLYSGSCGYLLMEFRSKKY